MTRGKRIYVLDTNVLMHDPTAIFRFQEHDVYLPMVVLEELDSNKKGLSEASRNVRQTSRFLDDAVLTGLSWSLVHRCAFSASLSLVRPQDRTGPAAAKRL